MVVRRRTEFEVPLHDGVVVRSRFDSEVDIVQFANALIVRVGQEWRTVELFDCTHGDRNDHHRYDFDGFKHPATIFHHGTPAEAYRTSMVLINRDFRRKIARWAS